jgi:hypothetical protein
MEPTSADRRLMPTSVEEAKHNTVAACANENAGGKPPAFRSTVRNGLFVGTAY